MRAALSMLMPTMNRSRFLARVLAYYADQRGPFVLWLGDASDAEGFRRNAALVRRYRDRLSLRHVRQDPGLPMDAAMRQMARLVETPYTVFCGDDDYLVPRTLERCVAFLDGHPDYQVACGTSAWAYGEETPDGRWSLRQLLPGTHGAFEQARPSDRILAFVSPLRMLTLSVHRTDTFRAGFAGAARRQLETAPHHLQLHELSRNLLALIRGKQVCVPALYHVMLRHPCRVGTTRYADQLTRMTQWEWRSAIPAMLAWWAQELAAAEGLSPPRAQCVAEACFAAWLQVKLRSHQRQRLEAADRTLPPGRMGERRLRDYVGRVPGARGIRSAWWAVTGGREISLAAFRRRASRYYRDFQPIAQALDLPAAALAPEHEPGRGDPAAVPTPVALGSGGAV